MGLGWRKWVWVELDIYLYEEECLSVRNAFGLRNSWGHQTFHGRSLGPGEGQEAIGRTKGRNGRGLGLWMDLDEISPKL